MKKAAFVFIFLFNARPSLGDKTSTFCVNKKKWIEFVTKVGWPPLIAHGGPKEPSTPPPLKCGPHAALWQTEHPDVFILYVEASRFVAEVIGQKQSLVLIGFI